MYGGGHGFGGFLNLCKKFFFLIQCRGGGFYPAGQGLDVWFVYPLEKNDPKNKDPQPAPPRTPRRVEHGRAHGQWASEEGAAGPAGRSPHSHEEDRRSPTHQPPSLVGQQDPPRPVRRQGAPTPPRRAGAQSPHVAVPLPPLSRSLRARRQGGRRGRGRRAAGSSQAARPILAAAAKAGGC